MDGQTGQIGLYEKNSVVEGDCLELLDNVPDELFDIVVTSPPYWGQRTSLGTGVEEDPRLYIESLASIFLKVFEKMKSTGILWINIGDAYNTPVNWRRNDHVYSTLGSEGVGLNPENSAYTKPRAKRKACIDRSVPWLTYGNLLALPYRLITALCDNGYLFRGEVIWKKRNPMPEGRCRRPHRGHEPIYLLTKSEKHSFRTKPPVKSVWEIANEKINGTAHFSRFPQELPRNCIEAYGELSADTMVLDPFAGSGTTGIAAMNLGCSFLGFEIDPVQVAAANQRLGMLDSEEPVPLTQSAPPMNSTQTNLLLPEG